MMITGIDGDFSRLLALVERHIATRLANALRADGATIDEWRVMTLLSDDGGHAMTEIADYAMLPAPTLTKVVDRMVSANLVYRRADETDRRRVLVFPSDRGREAYRRWAADVENAMGGIEAAIGGEEIALLKALLARASSRLASPAARAG